MKLGIIGAMEQEVETLLGLLESKASLVRAGSTFHEGRLEGLDVVVVQCGVGKVNAAMCVQTLIDRFSVTHIVNTGVAGAIAIGLMWNAPATGYDKLKRIVKEMENED